MHGWTSKRSCYMMVQNKAFMDVIEDSHQSLFININVITGTRPKRGISWIAKVKNKFKGVAKIDVIPRYAEWIQCDSYNLVIMELVKRAGNGMMEKQT